MISVKEYTKNIKTGIDEICINIHKKSKDQDTLEQLRLINSNVFMLSYELHTHGRETKEIEKLMSDLELFYWTCYLLIKQKKNLLLQKKKHLKKIQKR